MSEQPVVPVETPAVVVEPVVVEPVVERFIDKRPDETVAEYAYRIVSSDEPEVVVEPKPVVEQQLHGNADY